jgi:SAM-dependent methyltransferase
LDEILRILEPGGKLVILLASWFSGKSWLEKGAAFLFKITGQVPSTDDHFQNLLQPFQAAGYFAHLEWIDQNSSRLLVVIAEKPRS